MTNTNTAVEQNDLTDVTDLRNFLLAQIQRAAKGELSPSAVNSMANMCGKVIATVKIEHDHAKLVGLQPTIGFVGDSKQLKLDKKPAFDDKTGEVL